MSLFERIFLRFFGRVELNDIKPLQDKLRKRGHGLFPILLIFIAQIYPSIAASQAIPNCKNVLPGYLTYDEMMLVENAPTNQRINQVIEQIKRDFTTADKSNLNLENLEVAIADLDMQMENSLNQISAAQTVQAMALKLIGNDNLSGQGDQILLYCNSLSQQQVILFEMQKQKLLRGVAVAMIEWKNEN